MIIGKSKAAVAWRRGHGGFAEKLGQRPGEGDKAFAQV